MEGRAVMGAIVDAIINPIILLIFSAGVFFFMWGLVRFLMNLDNPEGRKTGQNHMLWGIVGVFIMATVFGIISIITNTLGVDIP